MQHDQFIKQVRDRASLPSNDAAEVATRAVLETLAERLAGREPHHAAAQLPKGLAAYLQHEGAGSGTRFSFDEFLERIAQRAGVESTQASHQTRVVMEVLEEALSPGEMSDIRVHLPPEYDPIFASSKNASSKN